MVILLIILIRKSRDPETVYIRLFQVKVMYVSQSCCYAALFYWLQFNSKWI
jgi:hypothetical protein